MSEVMNFYKCKNCWNRVRPNNYGECPNCLSKGNFTRLRNLTEPPPGLLFAGFLVIAVSFLIPSIFFGTHIENQQLAKEHQKWHITTATIVGPSVRTMLDGDPKNIIYTLSASYTQNRKKYTVKIEESSLVPDDTLDQIWVNNSGLIYKNGTQSPISGYPPSMAALNVCGSIAAGVVGVLLTALFWYLYAWVSRKRKVAVA